MTAGPEVEPGVEIGIGDFPGGLYEVTRSDERERQELKNWDELLLG